MLNNLFNLLVKSVYAEDAVGTITLPSELKIPSDIAKTGDFVSAIIRFFIIVAGLFTLWQFLSGGLTYITSNGDKAKVSEASNKITMSLVGLVIIAVSFIIIAIVSQLLFGSFTAILIPKFIPVTQ